MDNIRLYIQESIHELKNNVTWPTWNELVSNSILVLVSAAIFAIVTFFLDAASSSILDFIYAL
jgi:preprotein translocase subunit SecE